MAKSESEINGNHKMSDLVTVIITTYNRLDFLQNALTSVLNQTYQNIEVIVVDSSQNMKTQDFITKNKNLIYIHSQVNHPNVLRNLGLHCANGEYIAFLDDDDTWENCKIEKQLNCFKKYDIGLCYTGKNILKINKTKYSFKNSIFKSTKKSIFWDNFIGITSSIMVKKEIIEKVGEFDESLPALQDYDFCIRVCQDYKVMGINEALVNYNYNHHDNQLSQDITKLKNAAKIIIKKYPKNYLLKFGIWKIKLKRRLKRFYE